MGSIECYPRVHQKPIPLGLYDPYFKRFAMTRHPRYGFDHGTDPAAAARHDDQPALTHD
ncbi:hypothetical protein V5279_25085 [Bradyrhizobium sp. 26S5]|uniref:hypothetical protein n=1 Tax=Bradyrhizobium sp. 26S5 TaxID=3139729 RepID=UPI0030CD10A0